MTNLTNKKWWIAAGTRAIKTVAQTAVASIGVSAVLSQADWAYIGSASLLAGLMSILTSITGLPELSSKTTESEVTK
ncbi:MAG: holin [Clostridia bacterium]